MRVVCTSRLIRCNDSLKFLKKPVNIKVQQKTLKTAKFDLIKCLCDCAYNILHGNVKISKLERKKLFKFRKVLHNLCNQNISLTKKRKTIINQKGGFLPLLITPALTILSQLLLQ